MANTANRGWPLPDDTRTVKEEIQHLQQVLLPFMDNDVQALFNAISGLASAGHVHGIANITGLSDALAGKMSSDAAFALSDLSDVVGVIEAPDGYLPVKVGSEVVFVSLSAAVPSGGLTIAKTSGLQTALTTLDEKIDNKAASLGDLTDVDLATDAPVEGDTLGFDGAEWVPTRGGAGEPVGRIALLMGPNPDDGWLALGEGGTYETTAFPDFTTWMGVNFPELAAGTLPMWQGYSPRTTGGAFAPALRAKQEDEVGSHKHISGFGVFSTHNPRYGKATGLVGVGLSDADAATPPDITTTGAYTSTTGGAENRVKSFGVRWQIKAAGALSNPGAADMAVISVIASNAVRGDVNQGKSAGWQAQARFNIFAQRAWTELAPIAMTSGTAISLPGLPTDLTDIHIWFKRVSTNSDDDVLIQIGTAGAPTTAGYVSGGGLAGAAARVSSANGFVIFQNSAAQMIVGVMRLHRTSGNDWSSEHSVTMDVTDGIASEGGGDVSLAGALDNILLRSPGGTQAFDGGSIKVRYR